MAVLVEIEFDGFEGASPRRHIPVVVLNGRVEITIFRYITEKIIGEDGASNSTQWRHALALCRFVEYYEIFGTTQSGKTLLRGFWNALNGRVSALPWPTASIGTARNSFEVINLFADWLAVDGKFSSSHPNPPVDHRLTWWQQMRALERKQRTELLPQLIPRSKAARGFRIGREFEPHRQEGRGGRIVTVKRPEKVMSLEHFFRLISSEEEPRNLLLWLLLGAAGTRISEALQLYSTDIRYDERRGEARVILADPKFGAVYDQNQHRMRRQDYLMLYYGRHALEDLPRSNTKRAGWKGMNLEPGKDLWAEAIFFLPALFGRLFWQAHLKYVRFRANVGSHHPYYLVNVERNVGEPVSRINASQVLKTSCRRAGIAGPDNLHSLRHLYGDTLENELKIPHVVVQRLMRHRSPTSTDVYTTPTGERVRNSIDQAEERFRKEVLHKLQAAEAGASIPVHLLNSMSLFEHAR